MLWRLEALVVGLAWCVGAIIDRVRLVWKARGRRPSWPTEGFV